MSRVLSRFLVAASLVTALSSVATADHVSVPADEPSTGQRFARPPAGGVPTEPDAPPPAPRTLDRASVRAFLVPQGSLEVEHVVARPWVGSLWEVMVLDAPDTITVMKGTLDSNGNPAI